jgi:RNA polymerase sigma-70 factor (ECF subfamily)
MAARVMDSGVVAAPPRKDACSKATKRRLDAAFERELIGLLPYLLNFSRRLCGKLEFAEDIAQETLIKAWRARDRYEPGTNLRAWLFTILRHEFYSHKRRAWRQATWDEDFGESIPAPADEQSWAMDLSDCTRALGQLPVGQRETLLLVGAGGFSYEDAASLLRSPVGTLKSRLARGRSNLTKLLAGDQPLQPRSQMRATTGVDDILAQMSAVEAVGRSARLRSPRSR